MLNLVEIVLIVLGMWSLLFVIYLTIQQVLFCIDELIRWWLDRKFK